MILADIGNRHVHIYIDDAVEHLLLDEAIEKYAEDQIYYINVGSDKVQTLSAMENWTDISDMLSIKGEYQGMGVDRKALCLSHENGIFVDAGSAITVDKVIDGVYQGGFIIPGIHTYAKTFAQISSILECDLNREISLKKLPRNTPDSVSFGTIAPIVASIEKIKNGLPLYFTGGDGRWLSRYFKEAVFDEKLLFNGMLHAIKMTKESGIKKLGAVHVDDRITQR